jgi:hypothetical protein
VKTKERIVVGAQIKQLFEEQNCSTKLNAADRRAWKANENACRNFLKPKKRKTTVKW